MTELDWTKPIVTNAGKPARVTREYDGKIRRIDGNFGDESDWWFFKGDGSPHSRGAITLNYSVRNATPAEILAHPDIWPEWQDWARSRVDGPKEGVELLRPLPAPQPIIQRNHLADDTAVHGTIPQPTRDWLTPETAIGATLPCGAKVVEAKWGGGRERVLVRFDQSPVTISGHTTLSLGWWNFDPDGGDKDGVFPPLMPAASQPEGVWVTRTMLRSQLSPELADEVADALGVPPEPPKPAPCEAAYEAWIGSEKPTGDYSKRGTWQAAWAACEAHHGITTNQEHQP